jgi:hypothetical protein
MMLEVCDIETFKKIMNIIVGSLGRLGDLKKKDKCVIFKY